jgi:hypothetical protein
VLRLSRHVSTVGVMFLMERRAAQSYSLSVEDVAGGALDIVSAVLEDLATELSREETDLLPCVAAQYVLVSAKHQVGKRSLLLLLGAVSW